jgi:nitroreductase
MESGAVDEVLRTTRSVRRRLDLDRPVPEELLLDCIRISQQAPTGSDRQSWRWVLVTDDALKSKLADVYRRGARRVLADRPPPEILDERGARILRSSEHLADILHRVPVLAVPCIKGRLETSDNFEAATFYGSIFPAVWSFMLAARVRGLGTSLTTSHLHFEQEVSEMLGIPSDVTQIAIIPVAYYTGERFQPAGRSPAEWITSWNQWGNKASG